MSAVQLELRAHARHPAPIRRLKVLSFSHSAVNRTSGRLRYETLVNLRPDIDLTLVAPDRWQEYGRTMPLDPHEGILDFKTERVRLPYVPRVGWYLHYYPNLARLVREHCPDVIHLWEEPWSLVALQAVLVRHRVCPAAAIVLETDQNIFRRLPPPFEQIRRYTLQLTDLLIARQPESVQVARRCGFAGETAIVEYGVAPGVFGSGDRDLARRALDLPQDSGFLLGYVGRIVQEKGLHDVLDAMSRCATPMTLLVLGSGSGSDEAALIAHAQAIGLAERVRILPPRSPEGVAKFMHALDALVLMSRTTRTWKEQFGRVIMEAHACGVPVIGSDSGAIPGVVADGGWIVPEGNADALGVVLERLAASPSEARRAGAAGLVQASGRFSIETVASALADGFVRAAAARRG